MATERGLELERAITHSLSSEVPIAKEIPVKPNPVTKAPARVSADQEKNFEPIPDFLNSISVPDLLIKVN